MADNGAKITEIGRRESGKIAGKGGNEGWLINK
jgi:hypothetical protein